MEDFEKELKLGFLEEAQQLLQDTEQCFLELERSEDPSVIEKIFRLAHNLKGSAKAVGFEEMGQFAHQFESLLLKIKNGEVAKDSESIGLLLRCNDHIRIMVEELKGDLSAQIDSRLLLAEIESYLSGNRPKSENPAVNEPQATSAVMDSPPSTGTFEDDDRVETPSVQTDSAGQEVIEPVATIQKPETAMPRMAPPPKAPTGSQNADESIRVSLFRLERLLNFVGELVILQTVLREQTALQSTITVRKTVDQLGKVTKEVQDLSMSLRMVPVKQTFQKMQRIVRDTANLLQKKVKLSLEGEETELDKTVLENVADPLVHLIRNAVDHGIESAEKRLAANKPEEGQVLLRAYHQSGKLVIEVKDDGGGIDGPRLLTKAIEKGLFKPGTQMTERESVHLIFHPGFSTKAQVTEVSGRGVGMDVVKTNIEQLQGEVLVETVVGLGTTFKIILPLTLAIIDGMIVIVGKSRYIVPLAHVHESVRLTQKDTVKTTGLGDFLLLRDENIPLYRLGQLLNHPKPSSPMESIAIIVRAGPQPFGVLVDDIISQQQVVIKKLGREIQNLGGISGSAILGDGLPSLILELTDLIGRRGKTERMAS